ncbi:isoprenylcysteine carboxylmethyltransferase family protein [Allomuricauda sp. d1]|uniref:methyltransferase family protein n=1 Tax=Allomuricauda sp. d1 TaxID=3136725 RepID=UPI0031E2771E
MEKPSHLALLKAVLALPFMVVVVIPFALVYFKVDLDQPPINSLNDTLRFSLAMVLVIVGFPLFSQSVILFMKIGRGTLAPWHPTKKIVVVSPYRYLRNPMILGVILILFAEGLFFKSNAILAWAIIFSIINHLYFVFKEETILENRFGNEYVEYKRNVPRWIPRLSGWRPEED